MNKAIKIGLIALALIAIGFVFWWTLSTPPELQELRFDESYVSRVQQQCESDIDGAASFDKAQTSFKTMLQDIADGEFLENINSREAINSKKQLARHYGPVLATHADSIFAGSEWNEGHINALKEDAQVVLATNTIETGSDVATKLNSIVKNVSDYHAAKAATSCGRCSSVSDVRNAIRKANSYKREPLNNCTSLMNALNSVERKAKEALAHNIISACNSAASGHGSIDAAKSRINEYVHAFGGERQFAGAKSKLHEAENRAAARRHEQQRAAAEREERNRDERIRNNVNSSSSNNNDDDVVW